MNNLVYKLRTYRFTSNKLMRSYSTLLARRLGYFFLIEKNPGLATELYRALQADERKYENVNTVIRGI